MEKEYFAFISYQRQDEEWAKWIAYELEHYHLPMTLNGRADLPENLRPIFRDMDELSAGNLPQQIHNALHNAKNLIVICSPHAVQSPWVNKEILEFVQTGRIEHIFPFIVDGHPYSQDPEQECFPEAIRALSGQEERLGANVNENGRDAAVVKLVAGMLGLAFDTLWQRYEREKAEEERKIKEQRDNLLRVQSQFVSEKAHALVEQGNSLLAKKLLLEVLPKNIADPDRPYTPEAENALRYAYTKNTAIINVKGVSYASLSPDGKRIVIVPDMFDSLYGSRNFSIWDAETGQELCKLKGHTNIVCSAFFSSDGKRIVSASCDETIRIWDTETGRELRELEGHTDIVFSATFSPDGKRIVSASDDNTIRIWDAETGQELYKLEGHTGAVCSATFSPDSKRIVSASDDNTIRIWDAETGQELRKLEGHNTEAVCYATFSLDCKRIVSVCGDNIIRIYDVTTEQELLKLEGHTASINSVSFSPDGKRIVSASRDGTIRIWNAENGKEIEKLDGYAKWVYSAFFSPDGQRILSASSDHTVRIWSAAVEPDSVIRIPNEDLEEKACYISFSIDKKQFVSVGDDNVICIFDVETGQKLHKLEGHTGEINYVSYSPDGKRIVSASSDGTIRIWDSSIGKELKKMEGYIGPVFSATFSSSGRRIVSASPVEGVRIWDAENGEELYRFGDYRDSISYVSFTPDDTHIVSASDNGIIRIWDAQMMVELRKLEGHNGPVNSVSSSPDGKRIVSASVDHTIRIWEAETGRELQKLEGHTDIIRYATFSLDGKMVISTSNDKTIRVWDVETGQQIWQRTYWYLDKCSYIAAAFSQDGRHILTADDYITSWSFPPLQELIDQTRELFKDCPLTPEERKKYYLD